MKKKVLAIALALVLVLSMTSAFALYCDGWNWNCSTTSINCGKATVEVVPYVRSSNACGTSFDFVQSSCAAAIPNENIYFAIKVTIPDDMNEDWWNAATLTVKKSDVTGAGTAGPIAINGFGLAGKGGMSYSNVKKGGVYYLYSTQTADAKAFDAPTAGWAAYGFEKEDSDFSFGNKNVFSAKATSTSAKVCATLASEWDGTTLVKIGEYTISVQNIGNKSSQKVIVYTDYQGPNSYDEAVALTFNSDLKLKAAAYYESPSAAAVITLVGYNVDGSGFKDSTGASYGYTCNAGAFVKKVFDFMGISFDTCMTKDAIEANLGWDDEIKSCTSYSKTGTAVVDPQCVVEIPKTGDVSVIAYAVMALVAAAGAMGLKK